MAFGTDVPPIQAHICVRDGLAAIAFYEKAFGAVNTFHQMAEDGQRVMHANLAMFRGEVMLHDEFPEFGGSVLSPLTIGGIALLSLGTLLMSFRGGDPTAAFSRRAVTYALITSLFVASYTLTDGTGARSAATASSYAAWLFAIDAVWCLILGVLVRGKAIVGVMIPEWKTGIITGVLAAGSYWIAMWAFTQAPIAAVAALRETSILFAMLISVVVLREAVTPWRVIAALFIVAGVVALRLG